LKKASDMKWSEVETRDSIYLNLGGGDNCHPKKEYENYISVDIEPHNELFSVKHDLTEPIPLPDNSVDRIHSEDFLEHIDQKSITSLFEECYRILKPDGFMRIGVPDYNNPKDRIYMQQQNDPRYPLHVTFMNYSLLKGLIEKSPFREYKFYNYWLEDSFYKEPIDYSKGIVFRTPDNHPRNTRIGIIKKLVRYFSDITFKLRNNFKYTKLDMMVRKGHSCHLPVLLSIFGKKNLFNRVRTTIRSVFIVPQIELLLKA
jgi:predicted SAM-dependent methyltransferase